MLDFEQILFVIEICINDIQVFFEKGNYLFVVIFIVGIGVDDEFQVGQSMVFEYEFMGGLQ